MPDLNPLSCPPPCIWACNLILGFLLIYNAPIPLGPYALCAESESRSILYLLTLEVTDEFIEQLKADIPELPDDKKKRFIDEFKLSPYEATILVSDIDTAKYFEEVVAKMGKNKDMKLAVNWITGELFAVLNNQNLEISESPVSAKNLAILVNLIKNGTISGKIAKTVFELMLDGDKDPQKIVEEKGLKQQSDPKAIEALIDKIINDNREKAIEYKLYKVSYTSC